LIQAPVALLSGSQLAWKSSGKFWKMENGMENGMENKNVA